MDFENQLPEWKNTGTEPSTELKENGFTAGLKPPAGIFNWFWSLVTKTVTELQSKLKGHAENEENPHKVTAKQVGLDKVNNTADSEKSVKFASEAGVGRKVQYGLIVRFNGGDTEGTNKWTFDGSTSRSVNITPEKIGAMPAGSDFTLDKVKETSEKKISRIVVATKGTDTTNAAGGVISHYTATVDGVTELYNGMEITIIPDAGCTGKIITLNINGLGAVNVRQPLSFSTFVATSPTRDGFLYANTPCRLMYHANYSSGGIWLMADKQKTSAQDLYGTVPVTSGGTGASKVTAGNYLVGDGENKLVEKTPEEVRVNIGASSKAVPFTVTLTAAGWSNGAQTVNDSRFVASGYAYVVSPASGSFKEYSKAQIYAADVTTAGKMVFNCGGTKPSSNLTVNVCRMEVTA